jgi:hypothetical protein
MRIVNFWSWTALSLAIGALALGYASTGVWQAALLVVVPGLLAIAGRLFSRRWATDLAFAVFVVLAAAASSMGAAPFWLLFGVAAALAVWDLQHFTFRIENACLLDGEHDLARRHLVRCASVILAGLILACLGLLVRINLGFVLVVVLSSLMVLGLAQSLRFARRIVR